MKKSIKILTLASMAILLIACISLTIALMFTINANSEMETTIADLNIELNTTKRQMEKYKKELDAYTPKTADSFDSAEDLLNAIKRNPTFYNGKVVSVEGLVLTTDGDMVLGNLKGIWTQISELELRRKLRLNPNIPITIADDVKLSVVETGDRIKLCGSVTISDGKIYLDNCDYTMIETFEEMLERISNL